MAAVAIIEASSGHIGNGDSDVARAAAGDRGAFERLYRLHVNRVFSLCARMVTDRTRAEELTQDVFVRQYQGLGPKGEVLSKLVPSGILPRCLEQVHEHGLDLPPSMYDAAKHGPVQGTHG